MSATNRGGSRRERDAYATPVWCTEAIVSEIVWGHEGIRILEPCAGNGAIVEVLCARVNGDILTCDIDAVAKYGNGENFLTSEDNNCYDFIITNPPFSLAQEFIDHSLQLANCVIMLLPLNFLASQKRKEWWQTKKPTAIFVLSRRPSFTGKGTDSNEYCWMVWDSTGRQKTGIHWL